MEKLIFVQWKLWYVSMCFWKTYQPVAWMYSILRVLNFMVFREIAKLNIWNCKNLFSAKFNTWGKYFVVKRNSFSEVSK